MNNHHYRGLIRWSTCKVIIISLGYLVFFVLQYGCTSSNWLRRDTLNFPVTTGKIEINPKAQTKYCFGVHNRSATVHAHFPQPAKTTTPIDILLLFDHTNSMRNLIGATASSAKKIVDEIQGAAINAHFSVGVFADYPIFSKEAEATPWNLMLQFSQDSELIRDSIGRIIIVSGGDGPEAYSRGLYEAGRLPWREGARKIVILFGDSIDHDIDPGPDGQLGTSDDLRLQEVIDHLATEAVMVIGIYARSNDAVESMFRKISLITGGESFPLRKAKDAPRLLKTSLLDKLFPTSLQCEPQGELRSWVTSVQTARNERGTRHECILTIQPPTGVKPGKYRIPVLTRSQYGEDTVSGEVEISVVTGWYNFPPVLFIPMVLWLAIMLLPLLRSRRSRSYNVLGPGPPDPERYGLRWLIWDVFLMVAMVLALIQVGLFIHGDMVFSDFWHRYQSLSVKVPFIS